MTYRIKLACIITLAVIVVSMGTIIFLVPIPPLLLDETFSQAVFDEKGHLLRLTLSHDGKYRLFTKLDEIAAGAKTATLLEEDQYFYWHPGINPIATLKAFTDTYILGKRRIGASTITMQVARMRYKIHSKKFPGKIQQIIYALQLEARYSKKEIFEAYLNLAPYGHNVEGIGAASLLYFNKHAKDLTLPEALTLVVIPQNPNKRFPDKITLKMTRDKLFQRWLREHPQDKKWQSVLDLPLTLRALKDAPFYAPHFVNDILKQFPYKKEKIMTTLSLSLQNSAQHILTKYLARKEKFGVNNAAILVVDTRDMEVKALIGSADFFNKSISGQINGTQIRRSPGSTLKPFIYALAIDQGLIHPATVLKDVPRSFGSYNPENFDYDFMGPIKAKDALILSRNIPAVFLAEQLQHPNLYEFLKNAHIYLPEQESYYGLALVLGGAEINMQDLVSMYAMFNNGGVLKPLHFIKQNEKEKGERLLSPEASFLILDMLKESELPGKIYGNNHKPSFPIAFKTGTSSGYRDAWTIGMFGPYVIATWVGNFNNQSNAAFIGKDVAAPLFLEVANLLKEEGKLNTFKAPTNLHLSKVSICKASGMLPTKNCQDREDTWFIPGVSPIKKDTIFREIAIDEKTGLRACHFDKNTRFAIYEFWPSDLLRIFRRAGIARKTPPSYNKECALNEKINEGLAPQITSPQTNVRYVTRINNPKQTTIPFTAVIDADVSTLHWFLNETYLGKKSTDEPFVWHAKPGKYTLRVVDDYGRSDARELIVTSQ